MFVATYNPEADTKLGQIATLDKWQDIKLAIRNEKNLSEYVKTLTVEQFIDRMYTKVIEIRNRGKYKHDIL
jgi:hypothetical protein